MAAMVPVTVNAHATAMIRKGNISTSRGLEWRPSSGCGTENEGPEGQAEAEVYECGCADPREEPWGPQHNGHMKESGVEHERAHLDEHEKRSLAHQIAGVVLEREVLVAHELRQHTHKQRGHVRQER